MKNSPQQIVKEHTAQDVLTAAMLVANQLTHDDRILPKNKARATTISSKLQMLLFFLEEQGIKTETEEDIHEFSRKEKCVHSEHCCAEMGCKYGDEDCPVWLGYVQQSYPYDDGIVSYEFPTIPHSEFMKRREEHWSKSNAI